MDTLYQFLMDVILIRSYFDVYEILGLCVLFIGYYLKVRDILEQNEEEKQKEKAELKNMEDTTNSIEYA